MVGSDAIRLLLVEDSKSDADILSDLLEEVAGQTFAVTVKGSLREAREALAGQGPFEVILLDLNLPDANRLDTLCAMLPLTRAPIIVQTGQQDIELALKAMAMGAQDYLFKNQLTPELLGRTIRYAIERRKAGDKLRESEATLRTLVNASSGDYMAFWDASGDLKFASFSPTSEMAAQAKGVMDTRKPLRYEGENDKIWFDYNFNPAFSVDGDLHGTVLFARDITERKEAEKERLRIQKMDTLGSLAGGVAHDINNLLLPILNLTSMVARQLPEGSPERKKLDMVLMAAQRMKDMAARILTFSRGDEGEVGKIDIFKVCHETVNLLRSTLPATIKIQDCLDPNVGMVLADPRQIEAILMNLASNAADAMEDHPGKLAISLSREAVNEKQAVMVDRLKVGLYARLTVADTGCGMDAATVQHIYEPLFTTKKKGKGTGLGLSMVFGVVAKFGGAIHVVSEIGKGTTFDVYLPLVNNNGV